MQHDAVFHGSQVGVIGNLVHSSPNIKKEVLLAGALQPVIGLLRYDLTLVLILVVWFLFLLFWCYPQLTLLRKTKCILCCNFLCFNIVKQFLLRWESTGGSFITWTICCNWFWLQGGLDYMPFALTFMPGGKYVLCLNAKKWEEVKLNCGLLSFWFSGRAGYLMTLMFPSPAW